MRKAEAAGNEDCPVKIKLVAPPLYVLTTQTLDKVRQSFYLELALLHKPSLPLSSKRFMISIEIVYPQKQLSRILIAIGETIIRKANA